MTSYAVSPATATARAAAADVNTALDMPCLIEAVGRRCLRPVRFVVASYERAEGETSQRPLIRYGVCEQHADLYR